MEVSTFAKTIHTYKDAELKELYKMLEADADENGGSSRSKCKLIRTEQKARKKAREEGTYKDQTINPRIPVHKRLDIPRDS